MPGSVCKQVSQLEQTPAEHMIINTVETALNWRLETVVITTPPANFDWWYGFTDGDQSQTAEWQQKCTKSYDE